MTKDDLYNAVKTYLEADETAFNANLDTFVRLCEEDIMRQVQLPALRKNSTSTFNTGSPYIAVPNDYLSTYSLAAIVGSEYHFLTSKEVSLLREAYPMASITGVPRFFAQFDDNTLMIVPTPDQAYTVEMHYFYRPASLADAGSSGTTWLSINAMNALLFGTLVQGYIFLKGDQDVIKSYQAQYAQAIEELRTIAEGRNRKDSYRNIDKRIPV